MSPAPTGDLDLVSAASAALKAELVKAAEKLVDEAVEDIRKKLRARVAEMAVAMVEESYELSRSQRALTITVRLKEPRQP